jgi:hypothetical protein
VVNKQFVNKVLDNILELSCVDGHFYVSPVEHVLSGFVCNFKPSLVEVRQFVFPLFDRKGFLHLTYSRPALKPPRHLIHLDDLKRNNIIDEFVDLIKPLMSKAYEALSLDGVVSFLAEDDKEGGRTHPLRVVGVGYAYTLLGHEEQAILALEAAAGNDFVKLDRNVYADCLMVLDFVKNGEISNAQGLLMEWEGVTKKWLAQEGVHL